MITLLRVFFPHFLQVSSVYSWPTAPLSTQQLRPGPGWPAGWWDQPGDFTCSRCLQPAYPASDIYSREQLGKKKINHATPLLLYCVGQRQAL